MKPLLRRLLFFCLVTLPLSGCLRSLHPIHTEETLVFDPKLLGKWSEEESEDYWLFEKVDDEKTYKVTIQEADEDAPAILVGHLAKVGEDLYLDLYLEDAEIEGGTFVAIHLIPVHTFLRVKQIRPVLQMAWCNPEVASKILKKDPAAAKHEWVEETPILTASPEGIQKFFTTHRDTEDLFGDYSELKPVKPEPATKPEEKSGASPEKDSPKAR